jgi:acyl-CoA synthetase (AMP-forming)/AMP-acid ligase II
VALVALLDRIPLRARETHIVASPMFHGWGFLHFGLGILLGATIVLRRRFDPEATLAAIEEHGVTSAPMVPVMLQRIMALDPAIRAQYDVSSLRTIPLGGSALPAGLAIEAMDALGEVVYNLYGSTEVAAATVATPRDLRDAPGTAGRALAGTKVKILDGAGRELPRGETGRVFVGSPLRSDGYSGGGGKEAIDGLLSSGDLGHLDDNDRLTIDGREDDMIVSGGENVFPGEVEDVLARHDGVEDVAVATLTFASGVTASLVSVWHDVLTRGSGRRLEVFCERGLVWLDEDYAGPLHVETSDGAEVRPCPAPPWVAELPLFPGPLTALAREYAAANRGFLEAVSGGRPPTPGLSEGVLAHRLVDAVYASARQGRRVEIALLTC